MKSNNNSEIIAATKILLSISNVDGNIDKNERNIINVILHDFFEISIDNANKITTNALIEFNKYSDIYDDSKTLNKVFSYQDKIDFICCCFEVAISDKNLHYLENHFIKKIAYTLNIDSEDLINAKKEISSYLD
ncbi:MAG: hypothetical protein CMG14_04505 [Candidatus Marinimicrobia bacterium]|nr:hypothetical protein [Candidatus Neomarinimicrobiota bacterium]